MPETNRQIADRLRIQLGWPTPLGEPYVSQLARALVATDGSTFPADALVPVGAGTGKEIWLSADATVNGLGTKASPFKVSTAAEFDEIWRYYMALHIADVTAGQNITWRLYPGTYEIHGNGDIDFSGVPAIKNFGIALMSGWSIVGAGPENTVLKLVDNTSFAAADIATATASNDRIATSTAITLAANDFVLIEGNSVSALNGVWQVKQVISTVGEVTTFTVKDQTTHSNAYNIASDGTGGTVKRLATAVLNLWSDNTGCLIEGIGIDANYTALYDTAKIDLAGIAGRTLGPNTIRRVNVTGTAGFYGDGTPGIGLYNTAAGYSYGQLIEHCRVTGIKGTGICAGITVYGNNASNYFGHEATAYLQFANGAMQWTIQHCHVENTEDIDHLQGIGGGSNFNSLTFNNTVIGAEYGLFLGDSGGAAHNKCIGNFLVNNGYSIHLGGGDGNGVDLAPVSHDHIEVVHNHIQSAHGGTALYIGGNVTNSLFAHNDIYFYTGATSASAVNVSGTGNAGNVFFENKVDPDMSVTATTLPINDSTAELFAEAFTNAVETTSAASRKAKNEEFAKRAAEILGNSIEFDFFDTVGNYGTGVDVRTFKGRTGTYGGSPTWTSDGIVHIQNDYLPLNDLERGTGFFAMSILKYRAAVANPLVFQDTTASINFYAPEADGHWYGAGVLDVVGSTVPNRFYSAAYRHGPSARAIYQNGVLLGATTGDTLTPATADFVFGYANRGDSDNVFAFFFFTLAEVTEAQAIAIHDAYADIFGGVPKSTGGAGDITATTGVGTGYTITDTAAAIDLGTTDPVITIPFTGRYLIRGEILVRANGATATNETLTLKLRRTNHTAADLTGSGASVTFTPGAMTTLTQSLGMYVVEAEYDGTAGDALTIFAAVSAALGAGSFQAAAGTRIQALRIG